MPKRSRVGADRTGGSRARADVSPPVVLFSEEFAPSSDPPSPLGVKDLLARAKRKGYADADTEQAEYFANRIGYQHASLYFHLFEENGIPKEGASLRRVHRAVLSDRKLQSLLLENIGLFELQFRAQYALALASERGAFAHRNPRNFKNGDHFKDFLRRYSEEFARQIRNRNASLAKSFRLYGDAPVWQAVEVMSFGTLSMLYRNTRSAKVRASVASSFGISPDELQSWSRAIAAARNQCAHFGCFVGRNLVSRPKKIPGVAVDNGNPFYIVLILLRLLCDGKPPCEDASLSYGLSMLRDVLDLFNSFSDILEECSIPGNWLDSMMSRGVVQTEGGVGNYKEEFGKKGDISIVARADDGSVSLIERQ